MSSSLIIVGMQFSNFVRSVQLCCEEKSLDYSIAMSNAGMPITFKSEEHFALNPFGKIPVLVDGDFTLFETQSILRYLDSKYPAIPLQPASLRERALVDQWCSAISSAVDQACVRHYLLEFVFPKGENGSVRWDVVEKAKPQVIAILEILSRQLADKQFLVDEQLSLADILLIPIVDYLLSSPQGEQLFSNVINLRHYVEAMRDRPSVQKTCVKK